MIRFVELFFKRYRLYTCLGIVILLFMISYLIYINSNNVQAANGNINDIVDIVKEEATKIDTNQKIKVDVKGLVANPGVYELDSDSRVIDAINAAGGLVEGADTSSLNLSKVLNNENVIIVSNPKEPEKVVEYVYQECNCPDFNDACITNESVVNYQNKTTSKTSSDSKDSNDSETVSGPVSINTATSEQLQTLSGVGESKALAIIKYREENGPFNSIEEIKNVSGIGDALFEKIKDSITL